MFPLQCLFGIGLFANFLSAAGRYYFSWPLMPMYQKPFFLPLFIGILSLNTIYHRQAGWRLLMSAVSFLSLTAAFFPKDFYLPFIESRTMFSHLFLLTGIIGMTCFIIAGINAIDHIRLRRTGSDRQAQNLKKSDARLVSGSRNWTSLWVVWGFAFWTISMFSGEIWSYLGWGSPVLWNDAAIFTAMATWFYYTCFLHLHLQKMWNSQRRAYAAVFGAVLTLIFNFYPDLGKFKFPDLNHLFQFLRTIL
ncbi:MAG: cytochrome c biogenesis protein CcsA [Dissulfuribacterales bacterium]